MSLMHKGGIVTCVSHLDSPEAYADHIIGAICKARPLAHQDVGVTARFLGIVFSQRGCDEVSLTMRTGFCWKEVIKPQQG